MFGLKIMSSLFSLPIPIPSSLPLSSLLPSSCPSCVAFLLSLEISMWCVWYHLVCLYHHDPTLGFLDFSGMEQQEKPAGARRRDNVFHLIGGADYLDGRLIPAEGLSTEHRVRLAGSASMLFEF
ncbi:hypothetical protein L249_3451 [Ophiocordyceps polyrhachis-furcata BCC 54312]|uniref:Uncharacterized protein n=1 Tax=Ophiocordyceps polyrhachis-furcata BCC 54312 TaxID=1330021 RepID=A0A367LMB4_9HYPO|nr:hypothetical protein L249_3451 [Ophiocordyceps polyrhachis-furcata BCC 54312]